MIYELLHSDPARDITVRFEGDLLGEASSRMPGKDRWLETRIYTNAAGGYIVEKMGNSSRPGDKIRGTVHRCETARAAIECIQTVDDQGTVFFTRTARVAIEQACAVDPDLRHAYTVQDLT